MNDAKYAHLYPLIDKIAKFTIKNIKNGKTIVDSEYNYETLK